MSAPEYSADEMMAVAAARSLDNDDVVFVGIGLPSEACNLARLTRTPDVTLIYESGTIAAKPEALPLSIGDGELCESALTTVSVPEMFRYWLQGGKITAGFLGAAQADRFGNLNTTVIGDYARPKTRLPGGGGAPEIASFCGRVLVILRHSRRAFVEKLDFVTSFGRGDGGRDARKKLGLSTAGPSRMITDLCVMEPDPDGGEFVVVSLHPGVSREQVADNTGWKIQFADDLAETPPPTAEELQALRDLRARTRQAHGG